MPVRILCLIIGVVIICFGSAFYMTADLGVSTYDAVALIIVNTWKKGKFQYVRIITDIVCRYPGCVAVSFVRRSCISDPYNSRCRNHNNRLLHGTSH